MKLPDSECLRSKKPCKVCGDYLRYPKNNHCVTCTRKKMRGGVPVVKLGRNLSAESVAKAMEGIDYT
jgi:hypothetical protein